jgi:hypothetical protein
MLVGMAKQPGTKKMYVRPTPDARYALKRLLTDLQSPALLGEALLQEDLVAATWLWLAEMKPADVAKAVTPHLDAIHAYWKAMGEKPVALLIPDDSTTDVEALIGPGRDAADSEMKEVKARSAKPKAPKAPKKGRGSSGHP